MFAVHIITIDGDRGFEVSYIYLSMPHRNSLKETADGFFF
jgi:hypothetical protein